ncbi:hypothetical protein FGB62_92g029 [Gracilaria domingensis]|nr:hypothetical protein FGB62_92g029 [Gracilaria domingensis]
MPPELAASTALATSSVDSKAPLWVTKDVINPIHLSNFEHVVARRQRQIFRIPDMGGPIANWLYTRPEPEAISEDAFRNSAIESTSLFRMEGLSQDGTSITITPSLSSHWLMVPVQSMNGFTLGLAFLDILFQRETGKNTVPPLPVGRFVVEDATGEVFITGWTADIMICGWIQSVIKCERVRELLLYKAPAVNGVKPTQLLLRNSFFERRACHLCGQGRTFSSLPNPCSGINRRGASVIPTMDKVTNVASVYRRFRGAYFGVCVKTSFMAGQPAREVLPVFIDLRHGLLSVKRQFRNSLRKNVTCEIPLNSYFGMHPASSKKMLLFKPEPVEAGYPLIALPENEDEKSGSDEKSETSYPNAFSPESSQRDNVSVSSDSNSNQGKAQRRRRRVDDEVGRMSAAHRRRVRNRESAQRSNLRRKERLARERHELTQYKTLIPILKQKYEDLLNEQISLLIDASLKGKHHDVEHIISRKGLDLAAQQNLSLLSDEQ